MSKPTKTNKSEGVSPVKAVKTKKENPFAKAGDIIGSGVDALFGNTGSQLSMIPLDMIKVTAQIRESFEDEENTLADLAESIKARGVLQPILVRSIPDGYLLIAGERRLRASKLAGLDQIPGYVRDMTDEEAEDAQLAENIHRKNLTQIEEARKIQYDLDRLSKKMDRQASIDAILKKHHKSRAWLSKTLGLLKLPEQAKRLVTENVSADVEVISMVKTIEQTHPDEAKELVDKLKDLRGKATAREIVSAVKDQVKPQKKRQEHKEAAAELTADQGKPVDAKSERVPAQKAEVAAVPLAHKLNDTYQDIAEHGNKPQAVFSALSPEDRERIEAWLHEIYENGKKEKHLARAVVQGLRVGPFGVEGDGAFALVAFLQGAAGAKFNLLDIISGVAE